MATRRARDRAVPGTVPTGIAVTRSAADPLAADPDLAPAATAAARHRGDYRRPLARLADGAAHAAAELLALAAPVDCVCCGAEDLALCGGCERQVRLLMRRPFRAEAQAPALMDVDGSVLLPVVAAGAYRAELAQAVLSFKSHGQGQLAEVLSQGLGRAIRAAAGEAPGLLLVPVPTSSSAYRRRGFSPVHVLLGRIRRAGPRGAGRSPGSPPSMPSGGPACRAGCPGRGMQPRTASRDSGVHPADKRAWAAGTAHSGCGGPCGSGAGCSPRR